MFTELIVMLKVSYKILCYKHAALKPAVANLLVNYVLTSSNKNRKTQKLLFLPYTILPSLFW